MTNMKPSVLIVFEGYGPGGDFGVCLDLCVALAKSGRRYKLISRSDDIDDILQSRAKAFGIEVALYKDLSWCLRSTSTDLADFDLVHVHYPGNYLPISLGYAYRRIFRSKPILLTLHGPVPVAQTCRTWRQKASGRLAGKCVDAVAVPSMHKLEELQNSGLFGDKLHCLPNPVREPARIPKDEARAKLGLPQDARVCLWVGRIGPEKSPEILLRALPRIQELGENPILAFVGPDYGIKGEIREATGRPRRLCEAAGLFARSRDRILRLRRSRGHFPLRELFARAVRSRRDRSPVCGARFADHQGRFSGAPRGVRISLGCVGHLGGPVGRASSLGQPRRQRGSPRGRDGAFRLCTDPRKTHRGVRRTDRDASGASRKVACSDDAPSAAGGPPGVSKLRSSAYLIAANVLAVAIQFFSVPFFMRWFGLDGYGAYLYVVSIWGYVALACPDFATGAQKRITENMATNRRDLAKAIYQAQSAGVLSNAFLAIALGLVFGFVFRLPGKGVPNFPIMGAFFLAGLGFAFRAVSGAANALLAATERFGAMAIRQSIETLVAAVASILLAFLMRSPVAILLGGAVGAAAGLATNLVILRSVRAEFPLLPKVDWRILRDLLLLHFKALPHGIVNQMASGLDRLLLPFAGCSYAVITNYTVGYRLPEQLAGLLAPAIDTIVPDLTRQSATDRSGFAKALDRYGLQALMFSAAFILVPCGWGGPFLRLWLGKLAPAGGALVVLLIGFYFCLNFYFSTLTRAFRATGEMHFVVPFSGLNAIGTLLLTVPAARWAGIVGVAAMNAAINGVQIVPFAFYMRLAARLFPSGLHALRALCIVGIASVAAYGCYLLGLSPALAKTPWLCIGLAPVSAAATAALIAGLRLAPIPAGARRLFGARNG